ncbi:MAG: hypothetical protein SchgKO_24820 [Schleiferiaceae bacterium]
MSLLKNVGLGLFISVLLWSCTKEEASIPVISIEKPTTGTVVFIPEDVVVKASVSDPDLGSIRVELVDEIFRQVLPPQWVKVTSTNMDFQINYPIYGKDLSTGNYYIKITAANSDNHATAFKKIWVEGIPLHYKGLFAMGQSGPQIQWSKLDSLGNASTLPAISSMAYGLAVNSEESQVSIATQQTEQIKTYYTEDLQMPEWTQSIIGSNLSITQWVEHDGLFLGLFSDGWIRAYRFNGTQAWSTQLPDSYVPFKIFDTEDQWTVYAVQTGTQFKRIYKLNRSTGAPLLIKDVLHPVLDILPNFQGHWLIFQESDGTSIFPFDAPNNNIGPSLYSTGKTAQSAISITDQIQIWALEDGVYQFTVSPLGLTPVDGVVVDKMLFDPLSQRILYASGNTLEWVQYPGFQTSQTIVLPHNAEYVELWYNK